MTIFSLIAEDTVKQAERREKIRARYAEVRSYRVIGREFGITKQRVQQIVLDKKPRQKQVPDWLATMTPLLTLREACKFLNACPNTVRHWSNQGLLHPYRLPTRGDRRFRRDDLERFLNAKN
jgi:excisionase family DNA binding protein